MSATCARSGTTCFSIAARTAMRSLYISPNESRIASARALTLCSRVASCGASNSAAMLHLVDGGAEHCSGCHGDGFADMDFFARLTHGKCPSATPGGGIAAEGFRRIRFRIERCEALAANHKKPWFGHALSPCLEFRCRRDTPRDLVQRDAGLVGELLAQLHADAALALDETVKRGLMP